MSNTTGANECRKAIRIITKATGAGKAQNFTNGFDMFYRAPDEPSAILGSRAGVVLTAKWRSGERRAAMIDAAAGALREAGYTVTFEDMAWDERRIVAAR